MRDNTAAIDPTHLAICQRWFEAHSSPACTEVGDRIPMDEAVTLYGRTYANGTHLRVWIAADGRSEAHVYSRFNGLSEQFRDAIAF